MKIIESGELVPGGWYLEWIGVESGLDTARSLFHDRFKRNPQQYCDMRDGSKWWVGPATDEEVNQLQYVEEVQC